MARSWHVAAVVRADLQGRPRDKQPTGLAQRADPSDAARSRPMTELHASTGQRESRADERREGSWVGRRGVPPAAWPAGRTNWSQMVPKWSVPISNQHGFEPVLVRGWVGSVRSGSAEALVKVALRRCRRLQSHRLAALTSCLVMITVRNESLLLRLWRLQLEYGDKRGGCRAPSSAPKRARRPRRGLPRRQ